MSISPSFSKKRALGESLDTETMPPPAEKRARTSTYVPTPNPTIITTHSVSPPAALSTPRPSSSGLLNSASMASGSMDIGVPIPRGTLLQSPFHRHMNKRILDQGRPVEVDFTEHFNGTYTARVALARDGLGVNPEVVRTLVLGRDPRPIRQTRTGGIFGGGPIQIRVPKASPNPPPPSTPINRPVINTGCTAVRLPDGSVLESSRFRSTSTKPMAERDFHVGASPTLDKGKGKMVEIPASRTPLFGGSRTSRELFSPGRSSFLTPRPQTATTSTSTIQAQAHAVAASTPTVHVQAQTATASTSTFQQQTQTAATPSGSAFPRNIFSRLRTPTAKMPDEPRTPFYASASSPRPSTAPVSTTPEQANVKAEEMFGWMKDTVNKLRLSIAGNRISRNEELREQHRRTMRLQAEEQERIKRDEFFRAEAERHKIEEREFEEEKARFLEQKAREAAKRSSLNAGVNENTSASFHSDATVPDDLFEKFGEAEHEVIQERGLEEEKSQVFEQEERETAEKSSLNVGVNESELNIESTSMASFNSDATVVDPVDDQGRNILWLEMKAQEAEKAEQKARKKAEKLHLKEGVNESGVVAGNHPSASLVSKDAVPRHADNPGRNPCWLDMQPRAKTNAGDESETSASFVSEATAPDPVDDKGRNLYSLDVQSQAEPRLAKMRLFLDEHRKPATSADPESHFSLDTPAPEKSVETRKDEESDKEATPRKISANEAVTSDKDQESGNEADYPVMVPSPQRAPFRTATSDNVEKKVEVISLDSDDDGEKQGKDDFVTPRVQRALEVPPSGITPAADTRQTHKEPAQLWDNFKEEGREGENENEMDEADDADDEEQNEVDEAYFANQTGARSEVDLALEESNDQQNLAHDEDEDVNEDDEEPTVSMEANDYDEVPTDKDEDEHMEVPTDRDDDESVEVPTDKDDDEEPRAMRPMSWLPTQSLSVDASLASTVAVSDTYEYDKDAQVEESESETAREPVEKQQVAKEEEPTRIPKAEGENVAPVEEAHKEPSESAFIESADLRAVEDQKKTPEPAETPVAIPELAKAKSPSPSNLIIIDDSASSASPATSHESEPEEEEEEENSYGIICQDFDVFNRYGRHIGTIGDDGYVLAIADDMYIGWVSEDGFFNTIEANEEEGTRELTLEEIEGLADSDEEESKQEGAGEAVDTEDARIPAIEMEEEPFIEEEEQVALVLDSESKSPFKKQVSFTPAKDAESSFGKASPVNVSNEEPSQKSRMSLDGELFVKQASSEVDVESEGQDNEFQIVDLSHAVRDAVGSVSDNEGEDEGVATPEQVGQSTNPSAGDHASETDEDEDMDMGEPIRASTPVDVHEVLEVVDMEETEYEVEEHAVEEAPEEVPYPQLPEQVDDRLEYLVPRDLSPVVEEDEGLEEDVQPAAVLEEAPLVTSLAMEPLDSEQQTAISDANDAIEVELEKHVEDEVMTNPFVTEEPASTALNTEAKDSPAIELAAEEASALPMDSEEYPEMAIPVETPAVNELVTEQDSSEVELAAQEASALPMDAEGLPEMVTPIETPAAEPSTAAKSTLVNELVTERDPSAVELAAQEASALPMDAEEHPEMAIPIETSAVNELATEQDLSAVELAAQEASALPMDAEGLPEMATPVETPEAEPSTAAKTTSVFEITTEQEVVILEAGNGDDECEREPSVIPPDSVDERASVPRDFERAGSIEEIAISNLTNVLEIEEVVEGEIDVVMEEHEDVEEEFEAPEDQVYESDEEDTDAAMQLQAELEMSRVVDLTTIEEEDESEDEKVMTVPVKDNIGEPEMLQEEIREQIEEAVQEVPEKTAAFEKITIAPTSVEVPSPTIANNKRKRVVDTEDEASIGQATSSVTDEVSQQALSEDEDKLQKATSGKRKTRHQTRTRKVAPNNVATAEETVLEHEDDKEQPEPEPKAKRRRTTGRNPPIGTIAETAPVVAPAPAPAPKTRRGKFTEPTAASSRRRRGASKEPSASVEPEPIAIAASSRPRRGASKEPSASVEPEPIAIAASSRPRRGASKEPSASVEPEPIAIAASSRPRRGASKEPSASVEPESIPARALPREHSVVSEARSSVEPEHQRITRSMSRSMTAETTIDEAHSVTPSIQGSSFGGESSTGRSLRPRKAPASRRSASIEPSADEGKRRSGRTKKAAVTAAPEIPPTPSRKRGVSEIAQTPAKRGKTTKAESSAVKEKPAQESVKKPAKRGRKKL